MWIMCMQEREKKNNSGGKSCASCPLAGTFQSWTQVGFVKEGPHKPEGGMGPEGLLEAESAAPPWA